MKVGDSSKNNENIIKPSYYKYQCRYSDRSKIPLSQYMRERPRIYKKQHSSYFDKLKRMIHSNPYEIPIVDQNHSFVCRTEENERQWKQELRVQKGREEYGDNNRNSRSRLIRKGNQKPLFKTNRTITKLNINEAKLSEVALHNRNQIDSCRYQFIEEELGRCQMNWNSSNNNSNNNDNNSADVKDVNNCNYQQNVTLGEKSVVKCNVRSSGNRVRAITNTIVSNRNEKKKQTINYKLLDPLILDGRQPCGVIQLSSTLGAGANAFVRLGQTKKSNKKYAIKIYEKYKLQTSKKRKRVIQEIQILSQTHHKNIIRLVHAYENKRQIHMIFEYLEGAATLHDYFRDCRADISQVASRNLIRQVVEGVSYLHSAGISHRDIKCQNVLISDDGVKIIDFGFATKKCKAEIHCGTPNFMAPELFMKNNVYDPFAVDFWAIGVLLFYIQEGRYPFRGYNEKDLIRNISIGEPIFNKSSHSTITLIKSLLETCPERRINCNQILHHQWFDF